MKHRFVNLIPRQRIAYALCGQMARIDAPASEPDCPACLSIAARIAAEDDETVTALSQEYPDLQRLLSPTAEGTTR